MKELIFCINTLEIGGAEKVLIQLLEVLYKTNRYKLKVITMIETENFLVDRVKKVAKYEYLLTKKELKEKGIKKIINSLKKILKFKKNIKKESIVIDFLDGDFYKYTKKLKNRKIIWLHSSYESLKRRKKNILKKIQSADEVVTICKEMKDEIKQIKDNSINKKLYCIYNPFDFKKINMLAEQKFEKDELEYLKNKNFYVSVSRLNEEEKDITSLINAYSNYNGKNKLYIIGDGPDKKKLEKLVKIKKLENRIKFLGMKKNPYNWIKQSKGLILSSKFEGLPTVLIESLLLNKKTSSSRCKTGPNEILGYGEFGPLFEIGKESEIVTILNTLEDYEINEKKLKNHMKQFDEEHIVKKIEKLIYNTKKEY